MIKKTLSGKRLGDGGGMKVVLHEWGKSTHNLSQSLKTSMAIGTLVPFLNEVVLPGDEWRIKLHADLISKPTNGPLFGRFKYQADIFFAPYRLYQGKLHNNKLGIALNMSQIKFPMLRLKGGQLNHDKSYDNQQVNSSSLFAYLGIRGVGRVPAGTTFVTRDFNACDLLAYFDIFKNYYANTQENNAYIIHKEPQLLVENVSSVQIKNNGASAVNIPKGNTNYSTFNKELNNNTLEYIKVNYTGSQMTNNIVLITWNWASRSKTEEINRVLIDDLLSGKTSGTGNYEYSSVIGRQPDDLKVIGWDYALPSELNTEPKLQSFPLNNIDAARERILHVTQDSNPLIISHNTFNVTLGQSPVIPFSTILQETTVGNTVATSYQNEQEGLLVKTYQADVFNAWIKTDVINQITTASTIAVVSGQFTIDQLNLAKKTWEHLNRLAASKGTYRDFIEVAYGVRNLKDFEIPIYLGGMSKKVVFQEIVSNADTAERPLASIAGKGTFAGETKGGYVELEAEEAGVLMGIMSLTPYVDYTQGNKWHVNLQTMDDLHKPAFDGLGYQDLITDQFAWFDTNITTSGDNSNPPTFKSAGKVPAWINYMTSYNRALGTLADDEMWLILGRRYEHNQNGITDLTTYIDPKKFNYIWADARRDAQNFWVEITSDITVRRVMSAKQIPSF